MKKIWISYLFLFMVFAAYGLAPNTQMSKIKKISSINTPGLLVHGVRFEKGMPEDARVQKIKSIFTRGLLSENEIWKLDPGLLSYRNWYFQGLNPDFVSLDMISKNGYRYSAPAFTYGASKEANSELNFTIILNPLFVRQNSREFTATGDAFDYFDYRFSEVSEKGKIYNGIYQSRYYGHPRGDAKPLTYEVVTKSVPVSAFAGVIVDKRHVHELKALIDFICPDNAIQYFTSGDKEIEFTDEAGDNFTGSSFVSVDGSVRPELTGSLNVDLLGMSA